MIPNFASLHLALRAGVCIWRAGNRFNRILQPIPLLGLVMLIGLLWRADVLAQEPGLGLSSYPRPARDNGWGVHWAPALLTQPQTVVDLYLAEAETMNLRWLKLMQPDQPRLEHQYLLAQLAQRQIEPVMRIHKTYNDPYQHLEVLVREGVAAGVHYYELYANPNVAGLEGGWRAGQEIDVAALAARWAAAARTVRAAGGYPGLPSLSPGGAIDDADFLRRFLSALEAQNAEETLDGAWLPVQNYMGNRPLDDLNGFRKFEVYHQIVQEVSGRTLPILATEGGAIAGANEDARYPAIGEALVAQHTAAAFRYMQDEAPDYFLAFMPWLLVNRAAGGYNDGWEADAWFPMDGPARPVVDAIKALVQEDRPPSPAPPRPADPPDAQQAPSSAALAFAGATPTVLEAGNEQETPSVETSPGALAVQPTVSAGKVTLSEGEVVLPTYDYARAFIKTAKGDPIWPAPRLDHQQVGAPTPKRYRALLLENDFLRLTILPELGGRIYRWEDKATGRDILYHNPVVKPTLWGVRGWWLAAGGMEWSFPLPDHGLYEYRPWRAETIAALDSAAVRLYQNGPDGLEVVVTVSLNATTRFFAVTTELHNRGTEALSTHFWNNAMLAPGGNNSVNPNSRLVWPAEEYTIHSSAGSRGLPMGATLAWPAGSGEDLRPLASWPQHLSFFATPAPRQGATGLADGELAVIRSFPHRLVPGLKVFYAAGLDPALWTDGDTGPYVELWGGPGRDFDTPIRLEARQTLRWTEQWYTVPGLGAFVAANAHAALALHPRGGETELRLASTGSSALRGEVDLRVRVDGNLIFNAPVALSTGAPYRQMLPQRLEGRHWLVQLIDGQNRVLFAYDNREEPAAQVQPADPIEWDERLNELNVHIVPASVRAGQSYWKVVRAEFQNPKEGGGRHHIFIEVLDEAGRRLVGEKVEIGWQDGGATVVTEDKPVPEYAANFPMYNNLGGYTATMPGLSDTVAGMGLPYGRLHVVYNIVFQRTVKR